MIICLFGLSSMLIDMRVDTECTPSIPGYEKIPEPGLPFDLILEPNLEILPLYSWFIFHTINKLCTPKRSRTSVKALEEPCPSTER